MPFDPDKHRRRSIRLKGYDYSQPGAYFVTINTYLDQKLFGDVVNGQIELNNYGHIVKREWLQTANIRGNIELDTFVVMPDHFHGILVILERGTERRAPTTEQFGKPTSGSLPTIVRYFKSGVTRQINKLRGADACPVWQRNYYEHIVRNEEELNRIREYILGNPMKLQ